MNEFKLTDNQAALIIELTPAGEVEVDIAIPEVENTNKDFAAAVCLAIAKKLMNDGRFQQEILAAVEAGETAGTFGGSGGSH
ncbi:MAG: twitching motility protein [Desulfobulbaceae bacterium]|nr:twitching motility protein [Desulfobulbaceae bacterium]HIJ78564.1 twitching motility protein [Deltaproteobacteria bacterium]